MKDIFQGLYNKVLSFFVSGQEPFDPTKSIAMSRLKTVLMQDRVGFSERAIQMMKEELLSCVSKYMEIDEESFELQIDADHDKTVLHLSIPVTRPKSDDEIDEYIKQQELNNQQKAQEIVEELEGLIKERAQALKDGEIDSELIEEIVSKEESGETDAQEESSDAAETFEEKPNESKKSKRGK